jgi:hypothetical protein
VSHHSPLTQAARGLYCQKRGERVDTRGFEQKQIWPTDIFSPTKDIATSFSNPGACSRAVNQCNANQQACQLALDGLAGAGVTIVNPGTTIVANAGGMDYGPASATSICKQTPLLFPFFFVFFVFRKLIVGHPPI